MKDLELLKMFICGTRTMKDVDPKTVETLRYYADNNTFSIEYSLVDGQRKFKYFQLLEYIDFLHSYIESKELKND